MSDNMWTLCQDDMPLFKTMHEGFEGDKWEESETVLVWVLHDGEYKYGFGVYVHEFETVNCSESYGWSGATYDEYELGRGEVLAWMPLPKCNIKKEAVICQ